MLVLDENLPAGQQRWLRKWRMRFRGVGVEVATFGNDDANLIPVLHRLLRPTFFTLDRDFFPCGLGASAVLPGVAECGGRLRGA